MFDDIKESLIRGRITLDEATRLVAIRKLRGQEIDQQAANEGEAIKNRAKRFLPLARKR